MGTSAFCADYEECVYACDDHMPAGVDDHNTKEPACVACSSEMEFESCGIGVDTVDDARVCVEEDLPGLVTSLVNSLIVVPIYKILSILVSINHTGFGFA